MSPLVSKRLLQGVVAVLALIPLLAGGAGVLLGPSFVSGNSSGPVDLDSHFRFLSGIFLIVGAMFYATIPTIEGKTILFRMAALLVFAGGIARLISLLAAGAPSAPHLTGLTLELVAIPILVVWQTRVSKAFSAD